MQWLNYHHLYYFYTIASEGSITGATAKLRLAQSTLSAQLKQFEETIGYQLFERKNRKLSLTDVGTRVFEYAHEIFSLGQELRDSLSDFEDSLRASLHLGVVDSIPKKLSQMLVRIASREHGAKVTISEESLPTLTARLVNHDLDLVLANDRPALEGKGSRFHAQLIGELEVCFVTTPDRLDLRRDFPSSLNGVPIVMPGEHSLLRKEIMAHLKERNVYPKVVAEVDDLELQKRLVMDGHGFSALPLVSVEEELRNGTLIRLADMALCHEKLWLISGHRLVQNPVARNLLDSFRYRA